MLRKAVCSTFFVLAMALPLSAQIPPVRPPTDVDRLPMPQTNNAQLTELAAQIVIVHNVPGMVIAVVDRDGIRAMGAAGVRKAGSAERLLPEDQMHIGSCGKAITATLIARLVDQKKLSFDDTLPKLLPELKIDPAWAKVTLRQLLTHRAGMPSGAIEMEQLPFMRLSAKEPMKSRAQLAERVLGAPPTTPVGQFAYSNVGYALAGHIAEMLTGKSFESLLAAEVFEPLEITSFGFGAPGTYGKVEQPYGHVAGSTPIAPGPLADNPPALAPAGTMSLSVRDWGRFVAVHLGGGPAGFLSAESLKALHTPPAGVTGSDADPAYADGWGVTTTRSRPTLTHAGSNTMWFCQAMLFPADGWGILVATNQGDEAGQKAVLDATKELVSLSK